MPGRQEASRSQLHVLLMELRAINRMKLGAAACVEMNLTSSVFWQIRKYPKYPRHKQGILNYTQLEEKGAKSRSLS